MTLFSLSYFFEDPTIPNNYELLASVTDMVYNQFTVQIQFNLLKSSSGPVTNVGMLVTNNPNSLIQTSGFSFPFLLSESVIMFTSYYNLF